jgi:hypothetical protein
MTCEGAKPQGKESNTGPKRRNSEGPRGKGKAGGVPSYVPASPSAVAKCSGTPKSWIVTCPEVRVCALRASRSSQLSREWARSARESGAGGPVSGAPADCTWTSTRWWRRSWMQARRCSLRRQSRHRSGDEPTTTGCSRTLTWRGFAVAAPLH